MIYCSQMEKNAAAGRTPLSVPTSTPPPLTLLGAPRTAPPSPLHATYLSTKPMDSANLNSSLSFTENHRSSIGAPHEIIAGELKPQLGEERNIPAGKSILFIHSCIHIDTYRYRLLNINTIHTMLVSTSIHIMH